MGTQKTMNLPSPGADHVPEVPWVRPTTVEVECGRGKRGEPAGSGDWSGNTWISTCSFWSLTPAPAMELLRCPFYSRSRKSGGEAEP